MSSVVDEAHPSDRDLRDLREAAARRAEEARRRSGIAALRRAELAKVLAGNKHGRDETVERAKRAATEALARSLGAHEAGAEAHEAAAELYDRTAKLAESHGDRDKAARYREAAARARRDAQVAVRLAQEDRVRLVGRSSD